MRIVEETANGKFVDVKPGHSGELWIAGPTVFQEYVTIMGRLRVVCAIGTD